MAVTYDNNYIGYSCGFNSNGWVVVHFPAVGGVGTHLIDLYPLYYNLQPSFAGTTYGARPVIDLEDKRSCICTWLFTAISSLLNQDR
jgi:hypothetical protein